MCKSNCTCGCGCDCVCACLVCGVDCSGCGGVVGGVCGDNANTRTSGVVVDVVDAVAGIVVFAFGCCTRLPKLRSNRQLTTAAASTLRQFCKRL